MSIFDALRRSKPVETVYGDFLRDIESGQFEQALKKNSAVRAENPHRIQNVTQDRESVENADNRAY